MRTKVFLLSPLACACVAAMAQSLPTGGAIVQGAGKVSVNGNTMVVDQATNRMVADWQGFSIGAGNTVRFNQPSSSSVALNRVVGGDPSQIFGNLSANGHVYLQNPNGVLFAPGARIDVGSLVATTLNADVGEFMAGRLRLAGTSGATVVNDGQITTTQGGHVVLAAAQVANNGSITTPGGTTALVAAGAVNVDPTGSGLLTISVPLAAVGASLAHRGTITADGGAVQLHAAAEDAARRTVMQVDGIVRARSIEQRDGQIVLSGGTSGIVAVGGTLDASGGAGLHGGAVKVLGDRVGLLGSARVDASGGSGGGTVLVGGSFQGKGPEQNAQMVVVGPQATIDVSARDQGDGGTSIVWSDRQTSFRGHVAARGGALGGNGGFAEVSGKEHLDFAGTSDLLAPAGQRGTLLLDPSTLIVGTVADINGDTVQGDDLVSSPLLQGDFPTANAASQITAARVATLLAGGDVLLQSTFQLSVDAPLTVAAGGAASTLTLNSTTININAAMTLNNTALVADTSASFSDSIRVNAPVSSLRSVALTSADIGLNAVVTAPQVTLTGAGGFTPVTDNGVGGIVSADVSVLNIVEGSTNLLLTSANNRIGSLTLQVTNADVRNDNPAGTPMSVQGSVSGDFSVTATGGLTQAGALFVGADTQITTTGADAVVLTNAGNQFGGPLNFTTAGDITLAAQAPLNISGRGAGDVRVAVTGGPLTLGVAGINTTGALIDLTSAGFIDNSDTGAALQTGAGGRFFIRSSNYTLDTVGGIGFGVGANNINQVVLAGWTGAAPATGNVYVTNATGTVTTAPGDIGNVSKIYDGSTAFVYTQTGTTAAGTTQGPPGTLALVGYTLNSSGNFVDKNVGTDKAYTVVATNNVVATDQSGAQFHGLQFAGFSRAGGTGAAGISAVTPRALTSTGVTAVNRVYDATTAVALTATGATLANAVAGDTVTLVAGGATGTMADKNAGVAKPVTVAGLALAGADAANYTVTDASNATVTISPRAINAVGATAVNRVYDGTTAVALNTSAAALTGVIAGDTVAIAAAGGTVADKNVGIAKPVTIATVTLGGADAGNYVASGVGTPTVDITQRTVTATGITGVDREYDGTVVVALNTAGVALGNAVAGDAVALNAAGATGTMADKNVGAAKPVTVAGLTLGGADAANYALVDGSNATVTITPRGLTPTGITATNRVVDGTTTVAVDTSNAGVTGVIAGDIVVLDTGEATGSVETPDPGIKPVFVTGLGLTGADAGNYSILATPVTPTGRGLTVRILSVEAAAFEAARYKQYLEGISDAQEPFRRAMAEALAAGFGKENIRKQLTRGLVFETGLAAPAVDNIEPAARPASCTAGAGLACTK